MSFFTYRMFRLVSFVIFLPCSATSKAKLFIVNHVSLVNKQASKVKRMHSIVWRKMAKTLALGFWEVQKLTDIHEEILYNISSAETSQDKKELLL
jgi:hypothetical protein